VHKVLFYFFCLISLLIGCEKCKPPTRTGQILNINIPTDPDTLDPRKGGERTASVLHCLLFNGLMRLDDEGSVAKALAEKVDISDDRTVYTFHIRDCYWSDGSPVTAWDFEKSWKNILNPMFSAVNANLMYPIKNAEGAKHGTASLSEVGIRSINARTLEVTLERPCPYFLDLTSFCVFSPVNSEIDHSNPNWDQEVGSKFVCNGPFTLKEWKRNNKIVLEKNPYYYRADEVILEEIHFSMIDSEMTSLHLFDKGEVDILGQPLIPLPSDAIPRLVKENKLQIYPSAASSFCTFNIEAYPFNNVNIRKAFAFAINREEITTNITQLSEVPALGILPPILKKYGTTTYFADADDRAAKVHFERGLSELGISKQEFPPITFYYHSAEMQKKIAQALQQQWYKTLGIRIELISAEKKILVQYLKSGSYQAALHLWQAQYNDPMNLLERFKFADNVKNYAQWHNDHFASLLTKSSQARTNEERFALLEEAEQLLVDEMPIAPIFHANSAFITQPYIKSYGKASLGYGFYDRIYIDLSKKTEATN